MKRSVMCIVALVLTLCILIPANIITADAKQKFYQTATTTAIKNNIEKDAGFNKYATAQGSCTDGKYAYFAINNGYTKILKYDVNTWELKKKSSNLSLGHANDMAYNPKDDVIVVANNAPDYNIITFIDPDTLEILGTKKLKYKIYSIAYNEKYDQYVVGISGTYDFAILDSSFKRIKRYEGYESGYLRQGADCDNDYLYFVQSGGGGNIIVIYNWSGELVDTVAVDKALEIENIFHVGNVMYITLHYYGNYVYRIGISDKTAIKFKVNFDSNGGSGEMDSITVTYGKEKSLPACTFEKEGYIFGGWIMKRDSYNKYYGKKTAYSDSSWLKKKSVYEYSLYEDKAKVSKTTNVGDVTATAFWISETYRVYYDSNGGEGYIPFRTVGYDESFTLDKSNMTKSGFIFAGWTAVREYDQKVYGYAKGKKKAAWLYPEDVYKEYVFEDCEEVSELTYDLGVTFRAVWLSAFNFTENKSVLVSYIGIDENVVFPEENNKVTTIAENAFADNSTMKTVTIPKTITTVGDNAFHNCTQLCDIYFDGSMPLLVSNTAFDSPNNKKCYLRTEQYDVFLGWYFSGYSYRYLYSVYSDLFQ